MKCSRGCRWLLLFWANAAIGAENGWEYQLAHELSPRLAAIEDETRQVGD